MARSGTTLKGSSNPINLKNYAINGNFDLWQRGSSFTGDVYTADRFRISSSNAGTKTVSLSTNVPTGSKSRRSLLYTVGTADASVGTTDRAQIIQYIEGSHAKDLYNDYFTMSFWVNSSVTGTFCVSFFNNTTYSYVAPYTISAANTWEKKTITVLHNSALGTWNTDNSIGMLVGWTLMAGSTFQTTAGAWQAGNFMATSAQTNLMGTAAATFYLSDVMINRGAFAAPFRLFGDNQTSELAICQRYFESSSAANTLASPATDALTTFPNTNAYASSAVYPPIPFKVTKRTSPTVTLYDSVGNLGKYSILATGGASTNNLTPGDLQARSNYFYLQAGAVGAHAGFTIAWFADAEL